MPIIAHIAVYCLAISVYLYLTLAINPRYWLHRMPKAVTDKVPPRTKEETRQITLLGIPFLVYMVVHPVWWAAANTAGLLAPILALLAFFAAFTLWDTLVLDIILFCTVTPRFLIMEGTTKADYGDKVYHVRAGFKGLVICAVGSAVIGSLIFSAKLAVAEIAR